MSEADKFMALLWEFRAFKARGTDEQQYEAAHRALKAAKSALHQYAHEIGLPIRDWFPGNDAVPRGKEAA